MTYEALIVQLAQRTGLHTHVVRRVLYYLPDILLGLTVGDAVRTPLGVFKKQQRLPRAIQLPDQKTAAMVPGQTAVKLRIGARLIMPNPEARK